METPRIAIVVPKFPQTSETFILNKVKGLLEAGVDAEVLTHELGERALEPALADVTRVVPIARGPLRVPKALSSLSHTHPLLREAVRRYGRTGRAIRAWLLAAPFVDRRYDIVHFEFSGVAIEYRDALPLIKTRAKVVISCRGGSERVAAAVDPERIAALRGVFGYADSIHCVSEDMRKTVIGFGASKDKTFVNRPAVDVNLFKKVDRPATSDVLTITSTGSLIWRKGYVYALEAMKRLTEEGLSFRYVIIGAGPDEEHLRFTVSDLDLSDSVEFAGRSAPDQVRQRLSRADIFLLPSVSEGLSNAVLEAMAMGIPVVSSDVAGMSEAVTDGVEGYLVPPRMPEEIAKRLAVLASSPDRRAAMGEAGSARVVSEFTIERQLQQFLAEYDRLVT